MDLRKRFSDILKEYGHDVLVQLNNRKLHCRCYNELRREAMAKCPICAGTGYVSRIQKFRVREDDAGQVEKKPSLVQYTGSGPSRVEARTIYFEHNAPIQTGDVVYLVGWAKGKPTHMFRSYTINDLYEHRGKDGRIEYKSASVRANTVFTNVRNIVIRTLGTTNNYEFIL